MRARGKRNELRGGGTTSNREACMECSLCDASVGESCGGGRGDVGGGGGGGWSGMGVAVVVDAALSAQLGGRFPRTAGKTTGLKLSSGSESGLL